MYGLDLIQDFAIVLLAASLAGLLCRRIGLSAVVGYLVAGIVIGPYTPPFSLIIDEERIMALSQVGLVFLMFGIGLGLSISKFGRLGAGVLVATGLGAVGVLVLTEIAGAFIGWTPLQAMFIAAMLMVSSSAVIAKVIAEQQRTHERASQTALAVTVLEDVVAVAMLTLLASQAKADASTQGIGALLGGLSAFVVLLVGAGLLLVPRLMRRLEAKAEPEMQTVFVAGLLFALALTAAKAGYSIALGAFLFGAMVAEIPQKLGVEASFRGLRDMFSSVFFVSIGMMIDWRMLVDVWPMVLGLTVFALVARPIATGLALVAVGVAPREARRAGMLLTPLGEFSYIIAQLGVTSAVLPNSFYPVAVGASILTILATPSMSRHSDGILRMVESFEPHFIGRGLEAYHAWFGRLSGRRTRRSTWAFIRPRLMQTGLEMLFISGLLIFSDALLEGVTVLSGTQDSASIAFAFWGAVTFLVLVPLVAIWRNCSALALLLAQAWETPRLPPSIVERALKAIAAVLLASWLYFLLPRAPFAQGGWMILALGAAVIVALFSRHLIYWHSSWYVSMRDVLLDNRADRDELRATARAQLGRDLDRWNVVVGEVVLPVEATASGRTLAELELPQRFGCAVLEVERNGRSLHGPRGDFAVYAGDTLLLVGQEDQVAAARHELQASLKSGSAVDMHGAVLDTFPAARWQVGQTLAKLRVAERTGVRVVGIQREARRIINPGSDETIQENDQLLVLGTLEQLRRFQRWKPAACSGPQAVTLPVPASPRHA